MSTLVNWDRFEKRKAREFAMGDKKKSDGSKLFLPSHSNLDIRLGLKNHGLKRTDKIIAVDEVPENWEKIERYLRNNFTNFIFYRGPLESFPMAQKMKDINFPKIDFSFLDLCGHLHTGNTEWLFNNRECFTPDCRFGLTVTAATRFLKPWEKTVHKTSIKMFYTDVFDNLLEETKNNLTKDIVGLPIEVKKSQKIKKNQIASATNVIKSIKASCYTFMMAMNNFNMTINRIYRYKENNGDSKKHTEMVFIDFRFCGYSDGDDICLDVINEFKSKNKRGTKAKKGKSGRSNKIKPVNFKNAREIAIHMGIFGQAKSIDDLSTAKQSWIKINSKRAGLDHVKIKKQIKLRLKKYGLKA